MSSKPKLPQYAVEGIPYTNVQEYHITKDSMTIRRMSCTAVSNPPLLDWIEWDDLLLCLDGLWYENGKRALIVKITVSVLITDEEIQTSMSELKSEVIPDVIH